MEKKDGLEKVIENYIAQATYSQLKETVGLTSAIRTYIAGVLDKIGDKEYIYKDIKQALGINGGER